MATLKIFNTLGYQVDPPTETQTEADATLGPLIKDSVQFYIDRDARRVICYFRAKSDVGSSFRPDHFFADFHGDDSRTLVSDFLREMERLSGKNDGDSEWHAEWQLLDDMEEFNLLWLLQSAGDRDLTDLGLSPGEQLVIQNLVEEGDRLEIALIDFEAVAVTVAFLRSRVDADFSLAVSKNGRVSSVEGVDLVLAPGYDANFTPLSDASAQKMRERRDRQEEDIRDWYIQTAERALDTVAEESADVFEEYRTLSSVQQAFERDEGDGLAREPAETLHDLVQSLETNSPTSEGYDPRILTPETRSNLAHDIRDYVATDLEALSQAADDRVRSVFSEHVEAVRTESRPRQYDALHAMRRVADTEVASPDDPDHPEAEQFSQHIRELERSELLAGDEQRQLREEVLTELAEAIDDCVETECTVLENRFRQAIEELRSRPNEEQGAVLRQVQARLTGGTASEHPRQELPESFENVLADLENNHILAEETVKSLREQFVETVESREEELLENQAEHYRQRLSESIESFRAEAPDLEAEYRALSTASQLADSVWTNESADDGAAGDIGEFRAVIRELNADSLLSSRRARRVRREVHEELEAAIATVEDEKQRETLEYIENRLSSITDQTRERGYEETLALLDALREYARGHLQATRRVDAASEQSVWEFLQTLAPIVPGTSQSSVVLDETACREIRKAFRERVADAEAAVQAERKAELEHQFERELTAAVDDERLGTAGKVVLLKRLLMDSRETDGDNDTLRAVLEREASENEQMLKRRYKTINTILETVSGENAVLTPQDRRLLRSAFTDRLEERVDALQAELVTELVGRIEDTVEAEYVEPTRQDASLEELDEAVSGLEGLRRSLSPVLDGRVNDESLGLSAQLRDELALLDETHRGSVEAELDESLAGYIDSLSEQRSQRVKELYEAELSAVAESEREPEAKLAAYTAISDTVGGVPPSDDVDLENGDRLRDHREALTSTDREAVEDAISESREGAVSELQDELVTSTLEAVDAYCDRSRYHIQTGLESFAGYLSGNEFNPDEEHLREACETVDRARTLKQRGVLSPEELQTVVSEIQSTVSDRRDEVEENRGYLDAARQATVGRLRRREGPGENATSKRALLAVGTVFLLVLAVSFLGSPLGAVEGVVPGQSGAADISVSGVEPAWGATVNQTFGVVAETNGAEYTVVVYDSNGSVVHENTDSVENGTVSETVSVDASGEYFVQLSVSGQETTTISRQVVVGSNETASS